MENLDILTYEQILFSFFQLFFTSSKPADNAENFMETNRVNAQLPFKHHPAKRPGTAS